MAGVQSVIELTRGQWEELTRWSKSRTLPAGDLSKAALVLALDDGKSYSQIEAELNIARPTIAPWKKRFKKSRISGLETRYEGSSPRRITPAVQARVIRKTQEKPPDGSTHWSCRKMPAATGISPATVQRIWAKPRIRPHCLERYVVSNDPDFESKAADVIGLYMDPPQHAAVFCVDGKTAFRRWTVSIRFCRFHSGEPSGTISNISGTLSLYAALLRIPAM